MPHNKTSPDHDSGSTDIRRLLALVISITMLIVALAAWWFSAGSTGKFVAAACGRIGLVMGALWLATVPLTSGLVGQIYGLRYMGTLYGIVFFSHQLGSFLGVWLGGRMYDAYGSYTAVWWIGVGVGALSAVVHLPVKERPLRERSAAA